MDVQISLLKIYGKYNFNLKIFREHSYTHLTT